MSKRVADRQITKDDADLSDNDNTGYSSSDRWNEADATTLQSRKIVSVKRRTQPTTPATTNDNNNTKTSSFPTFSFGTTTSSNNHNNNSNNVTAVDTTQPKSVTTTTPVVITTTTGNDGNKTETKTQESTTISSNNDNNTTSKSQTTTTVSSSVNAPATSNIWSKFAKKDDEWTCPTCEITNTKALSKCPACDTPNPNAATTNASSSTATTEQPKFTFGSTSSTASTTQPTFTFGSSNTSSSTSAASFTFGSSAPLTNTGFTFGNNNNTSSTPSSFTSGFSFGSFNQNKTDNGNTNNNQYTFGSSLPSNTLQFTNPSNNNDDNDDNDDNNDTSNTLHNNESAGIKKEFEGKTAESSGEENDTILCKQRTRAFKLGTVPVVQETTVDSKDDTKTDSTSSSKTTSTDNTNKTETKWLQIGEGELHVNLVNQSSGKPKARFVLRADKTQRLVLNSNIFKITPIQLQNDKYIQFKSNDLDGGFVLFLLKFKSKAEAQDVISAVEQAKQAIEQ